MLLKTPIICHPEIAGEGIEYAWGASKAIYRGLPERHSTSIAARDQLMHVKKSMGMITTETARKVARKARDYKLVYDGRGKGGRMNAKFIQEVMAGTSSEVFSSSETTSAT